MPAAQAKTEATQDIGLIAEEVEKLVPEVVSYADLDGKGVKPNGIDYSGLVSLTIHEVQKLQTRVAELEKELADAR